MTYLPVFYAKSFIRALGDKTGREAEKIIENFISVIKKNNDWPRRQEIIEACLSVLRKNKGRSLLVIESARPLKKSDEEKIERKFKRENYDFAEKINPELMAGVRLNLDDEYQFDASLQKKLNNLFSALSDK